MNYLVIHFIVTLLLVDFSTQQDASPAAAPAEAAPAAPPGDPAAATLPANPASGTPNNSTANPNATKGPPASEFKGNSAWLRICEATGKYVGAETTGKDECPAGYWFKDPMKVGCACGHGVWVFASGWCDTTARIIIAHNGSCFNVNKNVKFIRQLGWSNHAFMPYHFVGTSGLEYVQTVPETLTMSRTATHFHPEYSQHIGAIFREKSVESMTGRFCLSQEGNTSRPFTMKYFVPKLPFLQKKNCFAYAGQDMYRFEYDVGYNLKDGIALIDTPPMAPFTKTPSWATPDDNDKCSKQCASPKSLLITPPVNNSFAPDYEDPLFDEYFLAEMKDLKPKNTSSPGGPPVSGNATDSNSTEPNGDGQPAKLKPLPEQNCSRHYSLSDKTMQEIQEQTKRMIVINLRASVRETPSPGIRYIDYKLMQKARSILQKVCPDEELPSIVVTGMHRMFRVALNESFFHYPFNQQGDDAETNEIWGVLSKCADQSKPMSFVYENDNLNGGPAGNAGGNGTNGTAGASPGAKPSSSKCDQGPFVGVDYAFPSSNRTIQARMPCHLWSNITDLDLAIETAWKTVMFTHYYCARHFGNHSLGFSVFEQKMERFFNRWIQHRWFYPGKALEGYKYIYQSYNLTKYAKALDRCVAAARSFSVYKKWIQRPTYVKFLGGKLFEEQHDVPDEVAGRTSLDAINPKLNQFNKKAYCLPYWHAPASNPGLNYDPLSDYKSGCVRYRKEEWESPFKPVLGKANGWRDTTAIL